MEIDVFISYSRRDSEQAELLCAELDKAGIKYWIDRDIYSSANFLTEICQKIMECKVVLFIASESSANSMWTQKEILYAFKHDKTVIPYRINKFSFDTNHELDFIFTNIQWVDNLNQAVADIYRICRGKELTVVEPVVVEPVVVEPNKVIPTNDDVKTPTNNVGEKPSNNHVKSPTNNNNGPILGFVDEIKDVFVDIYRTCIPNKQPKESQSSRVAPTNNVENKPTEIQTTKVDPKASEPFYMKKRFWVIVILLILLTIVAIIGYNLYLHNEYSQNWAYDENGNIYYY